MKLAVLTTTVVGALSVVGVEASLERRHQGQAHHHEMAQKRGLLQTVLSFVTDQRAKSDSWKGDVGSIHGYNMTLMRTSSESPDGDKKWRASQHHDCPKTSGTGNWKEAVAKAKAFVAQTTLEEQVGLMTGVGWSVGPRPRCVGDIAPIERLSWPGLCLEDSPLGVRFADLVSVYPTGLSTAAAFSKHLAYKRGKAMGTEHRMKGVNIQLGPGVNLHRAPAAGRSWEMAGGADPYLAGAAAAATIRGIQAAGVQANVKHYIGNEQEILRNTYSSNIDDRTSREIYEHPFLKAVEADVASVMCAYNLVNGSWSCQNDELINKRLKKDMGFQGAVISDWGAQHSGVASVLAGLDVTMPGQVACCDPSFKGSFWGANLTLAVNNGSVPASRVQDAATRILAGWYLVGQDKWGPKRLTNFDAFDPTFGDHVNTLNDERVALAREIGAAGTVLIKNKRNALPLKKPRKIAVVGSDAGPARNGANFFADRGGVDGVVTEGWGSGTADHSYLVSPYEALQRRARKINAGFYWTFDDFNLAQAQKISDERLAVDAALVFVHSDSGEGYITVDGNAGDRNNLTLWANGNELIKAVASVNSNTIVVIHAPGQVDLESFINNPNVTAVVMAHMPGSEAGNAIADVLFGNVNPSGRLPYTIAKKREDYSADVHYFEGLKDTPEFIGQAEIFYNERLNIDYRHFDAANIEPRFEFGFGLSYTKFAYSGVSGKWLSKASWNDRAWSWPLPAWMNEPVYEISFKVKNIGSVDGFEVPQLYLGFPKSAAEPPKVFRDFDRFAIKAGATQTVKFTLTRYDLSVWSVKKQRWWQPEGETKLFVGASSRDIRLTVEKMLDVEWSPKHLRAAS